MKKFVVFDLDGTLLDTSDGVVESAQYAARMLGSPRLPREELLDFIGPPLTSSFPKHYGYDEAVTAEAIRIFREHYREGAIFLARPYDGIFELCRRLKESGIPMAVATNKLESMARLLLARFGFNAWCDPIYGSDPDGKLSKADLIRKCIAAFGASPGEVTLIGDTVFDAEGAAAAGVHFLAVTYGFGFRSREDAADCADAGIADTPLEAAELLI